MEKQSVKVIEAEATRQVVEKRAQREAEKILADALSYQESKLV